MSSILIQLFSSCLDLRMFLRNVLSQFFIVKCHFFYCILFPFISAFKLTCNVQFSWNVISKTPKKNLAKILLLSSTLLNYNKIGCKQCQETTIWPFLLLSWSSTVHEFGEKLSLGVKSVIQIRENLFQRNEKNSKSAKFNFRENFMPRGR